MTASHSIPGLHHVTAISGPPQANVDFYAGLMGQRLVKRTVNFDDPGTYHLYYSDAAGTPGTILTFFPFAGASAGRAGPGMASAVAYGVPRGALDAWHAHLSAASLGLNEPFQRFGARVLAFDDPDGLRIELIETDEAPAQPSQGGAPEDTGFHSVTLCVDDLGPSARVLTEIFGYGDAGEERDVTTGQPRLRLTAPAGGRAAALDLLQAAPGQTAKPGAGTVHHVAFRAETDDIQAEWHTRLKAAGFDVTPVIDRQYFNAIYFREPGGILYEIATDPPGFDVDEPAETMGTKLMLPPRYEARRSRIEAALPPLDVPHRG